MPIEFEDGRRVAVFDTGNGQIKVELGLDASLPRFQRPPIATRNPENEFPTREGGVLRVPDLQVLEVATGSTSDHRLPKSAILKL